MSSLGRALAGFMSSSMFGSATQVVKGKVSAIFLGAAGVGVFNQLTLFFSLAMTLASLGMRNGVTRNVAAAEAGLEGAASEGVLRQFSSVFLLVSAISLLVSAVSILASGHVSDLLFDDDGERRQLIVVVALAVPIGVAGLMYQALLNGLRVVGPLVRARMIADGSSVVVFAALVIPFGIMGAALGFVFLQLAFLVLVFRATWTAVPSLAIPRTARFQLSEVRLNVAFGVHSVIVGVTGLCASLFVSRYIISQLDLTANGQYVVAVKIATVYLGGLYAAASGYFLSSVVRASTDNTVSRTVDNAIKLYLAVVAPIIVVLMATGDLLVIAFFTREFLPVASVMLFLLPGDALRLVAETMGQALIAQKKLTVSCLVFSLWAVIYCFGVVLLLPQFGLFGVAASYSISQFVVMLVLMVVCKRLINYRPSIDTVLSLVRALVLIVSAALFCWFLESRLLLKIAACLVLILVWGVVSMLDPHFANLSTKVQAALFKRLRR